MQNTWNWNSNSYNSNPPPPFGPSAPPFTPFQRPGPFPSSQGTYPPNYSTNPSYTPSTNPSYPPPSYSSIYPPSNPPNLYSTNNYNPSYSNPYPYSYPSSNPPQQQQIPNVNTYPYQQSQPPPFHPPYQNPSYPPAPNSFPSNQGSSYTFPSQPAPPISSSSSYPVNTNNYNQQTSSHSPISNYSQNGGIKKRALLIGVNYFGMACQLKGPITDIANMKNFIVERFNWKETAETMLVLTDDQRDPKKLPTRANMIAGMKWLVQGAQSGDVFFLHYSGHGSQVKDKDGDEEDGYDETILPMDFIQSGVIVDDEMHDILIKSLPVGAKLIAIFDSCHSGTALDLPYVYNMKGEITHSNSYLSMAETPSDLIALGIEMILTGKFRKKKRKAKKEAREKTIRTKSSLADVVMFSSSRDDQLSADTSVYGGAMSYAVIQTFQAYANGTNNQLSYKDLLVSCRNILKHKFRQIPQLSSSHPMDMNQPFAL